MYEQKRKQNEFIVDIVNNSVKALIEHIPNLIVAKMTAALGGTPMSEILESSEEKAPKDPENDPFIKKLLESGMSEDDINRLRKEGVDLGLLTLGGAS